MAAAAMCLPVCAQEATDTITIWMAGDSTMADKPIDSDKQERGWGQMLPLMLQGPVKVENHAVNGRSSKSFIDEGRWDRMLAGMKKGDYVIVQFGHNDEKPKEDRHTDPGTTFDANLTKFVKEARKKGATPIIMNSIVRRNFPTPTNDNTANVSDKPGPVSVKGPEGEVLVDTHGEYIVAPGNVARKLKVPYVDFNKITHDHVQYLGTEKSKALFMHIPAGKYEFCPDGKIDNTHLNIYGATVLARLAADALAEAVPELAAYVVPGEKAPQTRYVLTQLGIENDSTKLQTARIQAVIDIAEANGGGTIVVPQGTFLTGALFFKPGTRLHLEKGAKLKGSDNIEDFPLIPSRMEGKSIYYYAALVNAYFVNGFSITGEGDIDGNGMKYWKEFWANTARAKAAKKKWTNLEVHRPRLVFLWGCRNLTLSGVGLRNSPFWTTHLYQCDDVLIENCSITAPREPVRAPSSDAIDLDACRRVVIRGCYLNCDDDGVCLKGGKGVYSNRTMDNGICEDILVENCRFGANLHGVLTLGSECIKARNVEVRNCEIDVNTVLLRLKMRPDTYQDFQGIYVHDIKGRCGTVMNMRKWSQFFTLEGSNEKPYGIVRDIRMENINVDCNTLCHIEGNPDDKVSDVVLRNINVQAKDPSASVCIYPESEVKFENVKVNGKEFRPTAPGGEKEETDFTKR